MDASQKENIKRKTVFGVSALIARSFFLQVFTLIATFVLTIILSPAAYGTYFIVTAIISILNYFSDIGLAAALIQKRTEPEKEDLTTTFTLQQILVIVTVSIFWILSPYISTFFNLNTDGLWLLRALLISFFLSSLKTIPSILLERKLEFGLKVIPQILETITFYVATILFALKGYGILSFAYAAILRGFIGLVAIYMIQPWHISLGLSFKSAKELLSFGLPLQTSSILALIKDDLMTIFLGKILGKNEVGFIGWAKRWSEAPLRSFMDNIIVVSFPVYSRIAHDKEVLRKGIEKTLFFTSLLIFPGTAGLILIMKPIVYLIPSYIKWEHALLSFYFFSFSAVMASISSPLVQVLNSLGKAKTTFFLMFLWTALTWLLIPFMVAKIGFEGVAVSSFIISFTAFLPTLMVRRFINFSFLQPVFRPFFSTLVMSLVVWIILYALPQNIMSVIFSVSVGIVLYIIIMYIWARKEIMPYISLLLHAKK